MTRSALPAALLVAGCAAGPRASAPPVVAAAAPPPTLIVPPPVPDWRDEPLTPGAWRYMVDADGRPTASYGPPGAPVLLVRCRPVDRTVSLVRPGPAGGTLAVRTSFGERAAPRAAGEAALDLPARDPFWDQLAFSRGRFAVLGPGVPTLHVPAWAEPARVVEECRRPTPAPPPRPVATVPPAPAATPLPAAGGAPTLPSSFNNSERR